MTYPTLPREPDSNISVNTNPELRKVKFGGYSQIGPASLNNAPETWTLNWNKGRYKLVAPVYELMQSLNGWGIFTWVTPNNVLKTFRCESYGLTYPHGVDPTLPRDEQIVELSLQIIEEFR